jgi:uncharacterized protein YcaQ
MIQDSGRARFLLEALQTVGVFRKRRGQNLDRDIPPQARVPGAVDLAHPARSQGGKDLVGTQARSRCHEDDSWRGILGPSIERVASLQSSMIPAAADSRPGTMPITLGDLRRYAAARTFFAPGALEGAFERMGFVQADPIRAPARAQDLILRHRVRGYRVGDLDRRYVELDLEEDFFLTYGFVTRSLQALMHPRAETGVPADSPARWPADRRRRARLLLRFIRERGEVHPRDVERRFSHGTVRNYWGGSSNATTHLLDAMHYRGMLRVVRREAGIRIYAERRHGARPSTAAEKRSRLDRLVDTALTIYAPVPVLTLSYIVRRLRFAAPQWRGELTGAFARARERLGHARVDGVDWFWPAGEDPSAAAAPPDRVRLVTPFDPLVHDRRRFELLWGWVYRFEAYTPAARRKLGYYAMPLLWRDCVIGWGNLTVRDGELQAEIGYTGSRPRERAFRAELDRELARMREFLRLAT